MARPDDLGRADLAFDADRTGMGKEVSRGNGDSEGRKRQAGSGRSQYHCGCNPPYISGMTTHRIALVGLLACGLALAALAQAGSPSGNAVDASVLQRMLDAEDARASDSSALAPVLTGLRSPDIGTRRTAVRAIGRIERLENLPPSSPW